MDAQDHRGVPSPVQSFTWTWPTSTTPSVSDLMTETEVFDPFFSWTPVPGAAKYELEVNPTADFSPGSKVCCTGTMIGASHAPTSMLRDNTYYWRVRALDAFGNAGQWNLGSPFTKTFDKVPPVTAPSVKTSACATTCPTGSDLDGGTPGYQTSVPVLTWSAVPGASSYEVDVFPFEGGICDWSDTGGFDNWRIKTASTAWTMLGSGWGGVKPYPDARQVSSDGIRAPVAGKSYCARVRAAPIVMRACRRSAASTRTSRTKPVPHSHGWGLRPAERARRRVSPGTSARTTISSGRASRRRACRLHVEPAGGKASYFVIVAKDPSFSNIVDYAFHAAGLRTADERRSDDLHG